MPTFDAPKGMYAYPWDLLDEGIDTVLDGVQARAGLDTLYVTSWYHSGMFFLPHNPKRKTYFPEAGALYFEPSGWHGRGAIAPPISNLTDDWNGFWRELRHACDSRGVQLSSWMPVLHNSGVGQRHPEFVVHNAWGDPISHSLCPSHPDVVSLVVDVVGDVADSGLFDRILLESIEYLPLQHGYHHEVIGVPIDPELGFLLSLCFCSACRRRTEAADIDAERLRAWVRDTSERTLAGDTDALPRGWPALKGAVDGDLGRYLEVRKAGLTAVVAAVRERIGDAGPRLAILDFGPLYPLGPDGRAWQSGVDLEQQLPLVDEVHPTFYFTDEDVLRNKVAEYAAVLADERPQIPAIRAILPQTTSAASLASQVGATAPHASGFSFYNYGFMSLDTLDWIRNALARVAT
jgi:hypothetical protein